MIPSPLRRSLTALRIVMSVMIVWLSVPSAFPDNAALAGQHAELLGFVRVLAAVEIVAALLLLVPALVRIGAWTLIVVFFLAIVVHLLHGDYRVAALVIYLAATVVILAANAAESPAVAR
jgi:DoxX-like protein